MDWAGRFTWRTRPWAALGFLRPTGPPRSLRPPPTHPPTRPRHAIAGDLTGDGFSQNATPRRAAPSTEQARSDSRPPRAAAAAAATAAPILPSFPPGRRRRQGLPLGSSKVPARFPFQISVALTRVLASSCNLCSACSSFIPTKGVCFLEVLWPLCTMLLPFGD